MSQELEPPKGYNAEEWLQILDRLKPFKVPNEKKERRFIKDVHSICSWYGGKRYKDTHRTNSRRKADLQSIQVLCCKLRAVLDHLSFEEWRIVSSRYFDLLLDLERLQEWAPEQNQAVGRKSSPRAARDLMLLQLRQVIFRATGEVPKFTRDGTDDSGGIIDLADAIIQPIDPHAREGVGSALQKIADDINSGKSMVI